MVDGDIVCLCDGCSVWLIGINVFELVYNGCIIEFFVEVVK